MMACELVAWVIGGPVLYLCDALFAWQLIGKVIDKGFEMLQLLGWSVCGILVWYGVAMVCTLSKIGWFV